MNTKQKIIVILGQTSTGKSDFAVEIAKRMNTEIISADSRQLYKRMDIGTGKITKKEMRGIPHHLLDIYSPSKTFTVNNFQKLANKKIAEILKKNKVPIICGGTGFYIDAVVNDTIFPNVPPNKKLREKLSKKPKEELLKILTKLDKERAKNIDVNNPVRIIRAIEIAKVLGRVPKLENSNTKNEKTNSAMAEFVSNSKFDVLKIGLILPPEILKERIRVRLLTRIKKGMIKEVENLHNSGVSWKRLSSFGLEYRHISQYLQKIKNLPTSKRKELKNKMINNLYTDIWHFAKRQNTWFKRDPNIIWIDPRSNDDKTKILKTIEKFIE